MQTILIEELPIPIMDVEVTIKISCPCGCGYVEVFHFGPETMQAYGVGLWQSEMVEAAIGLPWGIFEPNLCKRIIKMEGDTYGS